MMKNLKRVVMFALIMAMLLSLTACEFVSSEPCQECGDTPTKGFKNEYTKEKEYYCEDCSSKCYICSDPASQHDTSLAGIIIFACEDCYEQLSG